MATTPAKQRLKELEGRYERIKAARHIYAGLSTRADVPRAFRKAAWDLWGETFEASARYRRAWSATWTRAYLGNGELAAWDVLTKMGPDAERPNAIWAYARSVVEIVTGGDA